MIRGKQQVNWDRNFKKLSEYKMTNGFVDRLKIKAENNELYKWVSFQIHSSGKLSTKRKEMLDSVGLIWRPYEIFEWRWNEYYKKLKGFKKKHKHCTVRPTTEPELYTWLQRNRKLKKHLSKEKLKKLNIVGVQWTANLQDNAWELMFNKINEFKNKFGHLNVKRHHNIKLYSWIQGQRTAKKKNKLPGSRENKLKQLGFHWVVRATKRTDL